MKRAEINRRFDFVPGESLSEEKLDQCRYIRTKMKNTSNAVAKLQGVCPREQALAITKLEEALSWAIAAIVRPNPDAPE